MGRLRRKKTQLVVLALLALILIPLGCLTYLTLHSDGNYTHLAAMPFKWQISTSFVIKTTENKKYAGN